ncbi:hypothetical protein TTHERM_00301890 (macronuclear) [Tetrahymena thermophila SB210]|uniref:Uncharacterized protein n=1 Tax=Tetrahymena thermophila (strain SB210) TaxID=312017 RepID=I7MIG1_TETTS|nr:hypothetical protein TTHERM_00301890 [Tetrahymena thermophila SB210]EAS04372.3 hypothetical protein TTHERM_00301890 [Tetrahymena thermophila SB210]|eukprot:XP_001024617.3 hypothetical protein TTHERM_00301890 [Tetrahymena thermophila SB210]
MSQNYVTILTYLSLINSFNMTQNSLVGSGPVQPSNQTPKTSNNIIVLSSDDDDNSTPKSRTKSIKSSTKTLKRTHSQLSDKTIQRRSTKSVLNSNFSLEDQPEPESAETDFNSPVASSQKHQSSKLNQQYKQRKISQVIQVNQQQQQLPIQEDNTLRKKSFFEELEEIAYSLMNETNKKQKIEDSLSHSQQSLQQSTSSSSSNLIQLQSSFNQPSQSQQQLQLQSQKSQSQHQSQFQSKQLDLIQEEDDEDQQQQLQNQQQPSNIIQSLKQTKQRKQRAPKAANTAASQKKQVKINQKQQQKGKKQQAINDNTNINQTSINNTQQIDSANQQINFSIKHKNILLNQNNFKFQEQPKKIQPPRTVFAEEVYLKSISQEGSIKLQKFPCFRDSDLQIPAEFSGLIQQQFSDDDKCSGDELLEKAVNYMHKKLVASTLEQNPSAQIPDAEKTFTIRDIKIDRDSEEEDEELEQEENNYSQNSNYHYSPYGRYQNKNNFLSDDEDNDDEDSN